MGVRAPIASTETYERGASRQEMHFRRVQYRCHPAPRINLHSNAGGHKTALRAAPVPAVATPFAAAAVVVGVAAAAIAIDFALTTTEQPSGSLPYRIKR